MGSNANATQVADFIELSGVLAQRLLTENKEAQEKVAAFGAPISETVDALVKSQLVADTPEAIKAATERLQDPTSLHSAFRKLAFLYHDTAQKVVAGEKKAAQTDARRRGMDPGTAEPASAGMADSASAVKVAGKSYQRSELADMAEKGLVPPHLAKAAADSLLLRRRGMM